MPASGSCVSVDSQVGLGVHTFEDWPREMALEAPALVVVWLVEQVRETCRIHPAVSQLVLTADITSPSLHFHPELLWAVASGSV